MATLKPRPSHFVAPTELSQISVRQLRKRETDRRCQREARKRTKARIASLEGLVDDLRRQEAVTAQKLKEAEAERDNMAQLLDALQASLGTPGPAKFPDQASSERTDFRAAVLLGETDDWIQPGIPAPNHSISQPINLHSVPIENAIVLANVYTDAEVVPRPEERIHHQDGPSSSVRPSQIEICSSSTQTVDPSQSLSMVEDSGPSSYTSCTCVSHINRQDGQAATWQGNFWRFACEVLEERFDWPKDLQPADDADSDDIPIRALLQGWDAVKDEHLHPSWEILSRIDKALFPSIPKPERLAMLKAMHSLLQFSLEPSMERYMRLPPWYNHRPSQSLPHAYAIDFFAWPGFREYFIHSQHAYCGNDFWYLYQNNMRLLWPHSFADCFTRDTRTGLFKTIPMFNERLRNINCWTMRPDFFVRFPELLSEIPMSNGIPPYMSPEPKKRKMAMLPPPEDAAPAFPVCTDTAGDPAEDGQGSPRPCTGNEQTDDSCPWPQMYFLDFQELTSEPSV